MLESGVNIYSIDESGFNTTNNNNYGYVKKGDTRRSTFKQKLQNVTLISAVNMCGDHYYSLVKGSNNQWTFGKFLQDLAEKLDLESKDWRTKSLFLIDNAKIHHTEHIKAVIRAKRLSIRYTAPASFTVVPCELVFSRVKAKYSRLYQENMEKQYLKT